MLNLIESIIIMGANPLSGNYPFDYLLLPPLSSILLFLFLRTSRKKRTPPEFYTWLVILVLCGTSLTLVK